MVRAGIVERAYGKITFLRFAKYGLLLTTESLMIASLYVWVRYLL